MADLPIVTTLAGVVDLVRALPHLSSAGGRMRVIRRRPHWSVAALSRPALYVTSVPDAGVAQPLPPFDDPLRTR